MSYTAYINDAVNHIVKAISRELSSSVMVGNVVRVRISENVLNLSNEARKSITAALFKMGFSKVAYSPVGKGTQILLTEKATPAPSAAKAVAINPVFPKESRPHYHYPETKTRAKVKKVDFENVPPKLVGPAEIKIED